MILESSKLYFLEIVWLPKAIGESRSFQRETVRIFRNSLAVEVGLGLTWAM